jgi:hypothetical protein
MAFVKQTNPAHTLPPYFLFYQNCLLDHVMEGKTEETRSRGTDVSSYLMTLTKRENTGT